MRLQGHLTLSDGSPLTIDVTPRGIMPIAEWLPFVLAIQMMLLVLCTWFAVRQAIRPLGDLAAAADALDPNTQKAPLSETSPSEVAHGRRSPSRRRRSSWTASAWLPFPSLTRLLFRFDRIRAAAAFSAPFAKCTDTSRQNLSAMDRTPIDTARWPPPPQQRRPPRCDRARIEVYDKSLSDR